MTRVPGLRAAILFSFIAAIAAPLVFATAALAGDVLFPAPLHIARQVDDPLAPGPLLLDEYYAGNRAVAVRGDRVSIADYAKGELLEIDRAANTFSRTPFSRIATARASAAVQPAGRWETLRGARNRVAGVDSESVILRATDESAIRAIEITFHPGRRISRDAFDVITGAAFPNGPRREHDAIARAAAGSRLEAQSSQPATLQLPLEEVITYAAAGETLVVRNAVIAVDGALAPEHLLAPMPGAKEVESPIVVRQKLLEELDRLPNAPPDLP